MKVCLHVPCRLQQGFNILSMVMDLLTDKMGSAPIELVKRSVTISTMINWHSDKNDRDGDGHNDCTWTWALTDGFSLESSPFIFINSVFSKEERKKKPSIYVQNFPLNYYFSAINSSKKNSNCKYIRYDPAELKLNFELPTFDVFHIITVSGEQSPRFTRWNLNCCTKLHWYCGGCWERKLSYKYWGQIDLCSFEMWQGYKATPGPNYYSFGNHASFFFFFLKNSS